MNTIKRYQECSWPTKIWRQRHLLLVPFHAAWMFATHWFTVDVDDDYCIWSFWAIAVSQAHYRMHWYYTTDEVEQRIKRHLSELENSFTKE